MRSDTGPLTLAGQLRRSVVLLAPGADVCQYSKKL
jgi:hypothetical protein